MQLFLAFVARALTTLKLQHGTLFVEQHNNTAVFASCMPLRAVGSFDSGGGRDGSRGESFRRGTKKQPGGGRRPRHEEAPQGRKDAIGRQEQRGQRGLPQRATQHPSKPFFF